VDNTNGELMVLSLTRTA